VVRPRNSHDGYGPYKPDRLLSAFSISPSPFAALFYSLCEKKHPTSSVSRIHRANVGPKCLTSCRLDLSAPENPPILATTTNLLTSFLFYSVRDMRFVAIVSAFLGLAACVWAETIVVKVGEGGGLTFAPER